MRFATLILLSSLFLSSQNMLGQDWNLVNRTDRFHFGLNGADSINATIRVDSLQVSNADTLFYLNRIVKLCDTCSHFPLYSDFGLPEIYTKYNGQFLGESVLKRSNDVWELDRDSVLIEVQPKAILGATWSGSSGIDGNVVMASLDVVLGEPDSIKQFEFSNGWTMTLSKSHGVVSFSDDNTYHLLGIGGRNLGTQIPDFSTLFNFQIGDVLQFQTKRYLYESYSSIPIDSESLNGQEKWKIQGVLSTEDSVRINIEFLRFEVLSQGTFPTTHDTTTIHDFRSIVFRKNQEMINETYQGELRGFDFPAFESTAVIIQRDLVMNVGMFDDRNLVYTANSKFLGQTRNGIFPLTYDEIMQQLIGSYSDSLIAVCHTDVDQLNFTQGLTTDNHFCSKAWISGLGMVCDIGLHDGYGDVHFFSDGYSHILQGFIHNGIQTGTITPDDVLLGTIDLLSSATSIQLSPNPAKDVLKITGLPTSQGGFMISDMSGRMMMKGTLQSQLDISELQSGVYFLTLKSGENVVVRKWVKE